MDTRPVPHVLFAAAAGPRLGFGHLIRCGTLASALRVRPRIALRASARTRRYARLLGWHVSRPLPSMLRAVSTDALIVDDPSGTHVERWVHHARTEGIPVIAIRDLGASGGGADLTIDGSLVLRPSADESCLRGPEFALLDPFIHTLRLQGLPRAERRVLIALGGGTYVRRLGVQMAAALHALRAGVEIHLAPGFSEGPLPTLPAGCRWLEPHAVRYAIATAGTAIVAGGITLLEAMALGTPVVAVALNEAQGVTTARAATLGAALNVGLVRDGQAAHRTARVAARLVADRPRAARLGDAGQHVIDGLGTARVVRRIASVLDARRHDRGRHAA